jgi:two-component system nitrogen regulation response regulator GlnG
MPANYPHHDDPTLTTPLAQAEQASEAALVLTVVWHPDLDRAGEQQVLPALGQTLQVNRFEPAWLSPLDGQRRGLGHACVSRAPLSLQRLADGAVQVSVADARAKVELNGQPLDGVATLDATDLAAGAMLQLGGRVLLCLHQAQLLPTTADPALLGVSSAMERLRRQIQLVAPTDMPVLVLVLGETGTGKELVAQAVHRLSPRQHHALVAVNMAALSESLAGAELFGAQRGAYTGANTARRGLWAEANGSTLFLDEIGDTPASVQPMLLRAMETGEYRPLGGTQTQHADVRLVAATDRALDAEHFNQPLLRRLASFVLRTPPLRERREDLGVLARQALQRAGADMAWAGELPPALLRALALHDWPGNVRELGHAVQRLALCGPSGQWPRADELLGLGGVPSAQASSLASASADRASHTAPPPAPSARTPYRATGEVRPDELMAALQAQGWRLKDAAAALGVSRPSLYNLMDRHPDIRRAESVDLAELAPLLDQAGLTLDGLVSQLRVPREALRRRLKQLGCAALPDDDSAA